MDCLKNLPKFDNISIDISRTLMEMTDILFAFCYENRVMDDDLSAESAFTINRLSSVLCCHAVDKALNDVIKHSFKRALGYPLIRHYDMAKKTLQDLVGILSLGKKAILRIFLRIKRLFDSSDPRYLLNNLYINNFCWFIQNIEDQNLI
jgi:protein SHQ1